MPLFHQLVVSDVEASTGWYESVGFDVVHSMPAMAHVRYRKYADVVLADASTAPSGPESSGCHRGSGVAVYVTVESETVDDVAERARSAGVEIGDGPRQTPWNTRELRLADPDGYELVFSEGPVDEDASFRDAVGSTDPE